ncbi:hypothetical protein CP995_08450 [Klebsiella pneumoniae]|nr:hypothetical protein CP995_08450 [Klebsiella pneumoniae]
MQTFGLRIVNNFDTTKQSINFKNEREESILEINKQNSISFESKIYYKYKCKIKNKINQEIIVDIESKEVTKSHYIIPNEFEMYYCSNNCLMFTLINTELSKEFYKIIEEKMELKVDKINFDFVKIIERNYIAKGVWYEVSSNTIKTKGAFGPSVNRDEESLNAIKKQKAKYLTIEYSHSTGTKTVGISKKSAIVLYNKFDDSAKEIELMLHVFNTFK